MAGLCTLANVKLVVFPTGYTDTTDDALIQSYIDAVTDEIQEYTGRQFVADTGATDYYFDMSRPTKSLYVGQGIANTPTVSFATSSQPASGGTYTAISAANVLLRPLIGERRIDFPPDTIVISDLDLVSSFYPGQNTVKVNMIAGFVAVPAQVERVALTIVVRRWQARKGGQTDTIGADAYGGTLLRFSSPEDMATLNRYVDVSVG